MILKPTQLTGQIKKFIDFSVTDQDFRTIHPKVVVVSCPGNQDLCGGL